MITKQELILKNEWWGDNQYFPEEVSWPKRDLFTVLEDNLEAPMILNLVGLRRVGKSTILRQLIGGLLDKKIKASNIFYFLFDYSSQIQKPEFLDEVLSVYFREVLNNPALSFNERIYVFLDEVQYIEDWQAVLKRYYDLSGKKIKFIVTGSQSMLLKGKYRESLAGRIFDYYLPPLSFREFIKIHQENLPVFKPFNLLKLPDCFAELVAYDVYHGARANVLSQEYLTTGQFPETRQLLNLNSRQEYIAESIIGKVIADCLRVFKIEKPDEFKLITWYILNNVSSVFEQVNVGREVAVSRLTLDKYLGYLKETYLLEILYKYHKSLIKRGRILKKSYTSCTNFTCALNRYDEKHFTEVPEVFGKIIENAVYNLLNLKYPNNEIHQALSFWRHGEKEIDFLVNQGEGQLAIEVKFSKQVNLRDLVALTDYVRQKKLPFGVVITKQEIAKKEVQGQVLYYLPYYLILQMI